jgi:hypothetical protein
LILQMLRRAAHGDKRVQLAPLTDFGPSFHADMRQQPRVFAELDVFADDRIRPDLNPVGQLCLGVNHRGGMNLHFNDLLRIA